MKNCCASIEYSVDFTGFSHLGSDSRKTFFVHTPNEHSADLKQSILLPTVTTVRHQAPRDKRNLSKIGNILENFPETGIDF